MSVWERIAIINQLDLIGQKDWKLIKESIAHKYMRDTPKVMPLVL